MHELAEVIFWSCFALFVTVKKKKNQDTTTPLVKVTERAQCYFTALVEDSLISDLT